MVLAALNGRVLQAERQQLRGRVEVGQTHKTNILSLNTNQIFEIFQLIALLYVVNRIP